MSGGRFARYCIEGLQRMYMASDHVFSASYRLTGGRMVHLRDRVLEYKYTMNSLMGLRRAEAGGLRVFIDTEADFHRVASQVAGDVASPESIAATVWAGGCLATGIPSTAMSQFKAVFFSHLAPTTPTKVTAQAVAWAIAACSLRGEEYLDRALVLAEVAASHYIHQGTALVRHVPLGMRRDWASFAASCYMAYALLSLARVTGSQRARDLGIRTARALVQLQGPQGQWGWFYHIPTGRLVDYYPVYSVHQHSMAPFFLLEAIDQGYPEFREPLLSGFRWVLGGNELGVSMVAGEQRIIWRSAVRRQALPKLSRSARAAGVALLGGSRRPMTSGRGLLINHECRSYELAWGLWAFGGRSDFSEILDHESFCSPEMSSA